MQIFGRVINLILCAITIWQIVVIANFPTIPKGPNGGPDSFTVAAGKAKFRHGNFQQGQDDNRDGQRQNIQVFLVLMVTFVTPTELMYLRSLIKAFRNRSKEAVPADCTQKTFGFFFVVRTYPPALFYRSILSFFSRCFVFCVLCLIFLFKRSGI